MCKELETALFHRMNAKRCAVCRALFTPGSNRAKYGSPCVGICHREMERWLKERKRKK